MKKIIYSGLIAVTLLGSGGITAFADETLPADPTTPPTEVPTNPSTPDLPPDPVTPPVEPTDPSTEPVTPDKPSEPSTEPVTPDKPSEPSTEPVTPDKPSEPSTEPVTPDKPSEPSTEPVTPDKPSEPSTEPVTPDKPSEPSKPAKPVDVVVTPSGEITNNVDNSNQPSVPIVTSNIKEITHVPTPNTPLLTASGETIVAVQDGTPLKQTAEGLKPIQSDFKVLPSGNVEVKTADGKLKVLPKTGEESTLLLALLGNLLVFMSLFFVFKKNKHEKEVAYSFVGNETQEPKNEQAKYEFFVRTTNIGKRKLKNLQRAINGFIFRND